MIEVTKDKSKILANLEKEIERSYRIAEDNWFTVGKSLSKIRDQKLHKQRTFEQYCLQRWGFKRHRAYQLCSAYEITQKRLDVERGQHFIPTSDKHVRMLKDVPVEQHAEVLEDAKDAKGKVTTESVKKAAAGKTKPKDEIPKDREGYPIPTPAMKVWNRRYEVRPKLAFLAEMRQWAEDMQGSNDPLYAEIVFSALKLDIEAVESRLKLAVPYVVCSQCQGQAVETCTMCKGRGMISKYRYHGIPATPVEMKEIRQKLAAGSS